MSVALLDVNVLIAMFVPIHANHERAHQWLNRNKQGGWATCPITVNGCIRILSNPSCPGVYSSLTELAALVRENCSGRDHHFWEDSVSLLDETLFQTANLGGHKKITDAYLLGLAVRNHGRLATFDRNIPLQAVHGAKPSHVVFIGA